jgi:hypothetical protein
VDTSQRNAETPQDSKATTRLADGDAEALRKAIERILSEASSDMRSGPLFDDELRAALRPVCARARARRVHAEQLIVSIKHIFASLPAALGPESGSADGKLNRTITLCIDEYYRELDD